MLWALLVPLVHCFAHLRQLEEWQWCSTFIAWAQTFTCTGFFFFFLHHILLDLSPPLLVTWHIHRSYWIAPLSPIILHVRFCIPITYSSNDFLVALLHLNLLFILIISSWQASLYLLRPHDAPLNRKLAPLCINSHFPASSSDFCTFFYH